ncbi:hypothetical protein Bra1253DRAFT_04776 [Bradyrhizobium sp. WSM1253]|nr:hypothetical protein Bra1253DRAFT_04776 [Bradyrhizobium sp. WSM1253]
MRGPDSFVIARSEATKQSRLLPRTQSGLLRFARNDDCNAHTAFTRTRNPSRGFGIGHICQSGL